MRVEILLVVAILCLVGTVSSHSDDYVGHGGWSEEFDPWISSPLCTIERRSSLSVEEFENEYLRNKPVIFDAPQNNDIFRDHTARHYLEEAFGDIVMMLSSANTYSTRKQYLSLSEYLDSYIQSQDLDQTGDNTFYLFGGNHPTLDAELLSEYVRPPFAQANEMGSLSFGIAGSGSGVPLHRHGHVFAEVFYGRKRWFLYPPEFHPPFDPDASTIQWLHHVYPTLDEPSKPMECELLPGQLIYIPDWWWHATLNIGETVFISTFV